MGRKTTQKTSTEKEMREIKFRAWHPLEKVWFEWKQNKWSNYDYEFVSELPNGNTMSTLWGDKNLKVVQFTGLKDKNGKDIYEGDIIEMVWMNQHLEGTKYRGEVKWSKWCYHLVGGDGHSKVLDTISLASRHPEVIGNIYENPVLLTHSTAE